MKVLRHILAACLAAALLCTSAFASSGFNAGLVIDRETEGQISVTVQDSSVLREKKPTLTIPCDFAYARVTCPDSSIAYCTGTGNEISFTVFMGGTYLIESISELPSEGGSGSQPGGGSSGGSGSTVTTSTTQNEDGSTTVTTVNTLTGVVTKSTTTADGVTGTTVAAKDGTVTEISASVSVAAAENAAASGKSVTLPVEVPVVAGGEETAAVEISVPASVREVTVEIPVDALSVGLVAVAVAEDGTEEVITGSRMGEAGVVVKLDGNATLKIVDNSKEFEDLENSQSWVTEAVAYTSARELFNGITTTHFGPEVDTTRGMVVAVLHRMASEPETDAENIFNDVSDKAYYADAVKWAAENEIVKGYGDSFGATDTITREQLAVMLYNYAQYIGADTSARADLEADFTDGGSTHSWAKDALSWANAMGLLKGFGNGEIAPTGSATRAQVAAVIYRFCETVAK